MGLISSPTSSTNSRCLSPYTDRSGTSQEHHVSVNVAVRIKPALNVNVRQSQSVIVESSDTTIAVKYSNKVKSYQFDKILGESSNQQDIFDHISQSVNQLIDGYNVSLMAYGQSGAGKSYTMGTVDSENFVTNEISRGLVHRVASTLFVRVTGTELSKSAIPTKIPSPRIPKHTLKIDKNASKPYALSVTYLEIYNEQLRDLLHPTQTGLVIRENVKGDITVQNLKEVAVENVEDLLKLLQRGSNERQTSATAINAQSSRSHAIFTIHLTKRHENPDTHIMTTVTSKVNFVDLAGSERLKNTQVGDGRVKEGISINSGLTALGKVISQLSLHHNHVSYRDSKLTRALQDSLGGKAITYIIACISTEPQYVSETINTLSYAQRARSIQLTPEIRSAMVDKSQSKEELLVLVNQLQQELKQLRSNGLSPRDGRTSIGSNSENATLFGGSPPASPEASSVAGEFKINGIDSPRGRINRSSQLHTAIQEAMDQYDNTIATLQKTILELRCSIDETEVELELALTNIASLEEMLDVYRQREEHLDDIILQRKQGAEYGEHIGNLADPAQLSEQIEKLQKEVNAHRAEHKSHVAEVQYLTTQYNRALDRTKQLEEENQLLKDRLKPDFQLAGIKQS